MNRAFSIFSLATILVLANFVLGSSALKTINISELGDKPIAIDIAQFGQEHKAALLDRSRATRFIGDLIHGSEHPNQKIYSDAFQITNDSPNDISGSLTFTVNGIINLVGVLNRAGSYVVVCATPYTLGSSTSIVDVRVMANSVSVIDVIIAAH